MSNLSIASITTAFKDAARNGQRVMVGWTTPQGDKKYNFLLAINGESLALRGDSGSYGCSYAVPVERVLSADLMGRPQRVGPKPRRWGIVA